HQAEALAVGAMHMQEEAVDCCVERTERRAERLLDVLVRRDVVFTGVPLPQGSAWAVDWGRFDLHWAPRSELQLPAYGAEGKLRHGEAEQHKDENEAGCKAGDDNVAR